MSKTLINNILLLFLMLAVPIEAKAQDCTLVEEAILRLLPPSFGRSRSWDILYGDVGYERFSDIVMVDNERVIVAGDYTVGEDDTTYKPLIAEMDYRARTTWEVREETDRNHPITSITKTQNGVTVLGEIVDPKRGRGLYMAHYDSKGKRTGKVPIFEKDTDLDAVSIVESHDGKNFIIAAQYHNQKDLGDKYGLLFKVDKAGKIIWRRAYRPGIVTFFNNLQSLPDQAYLASGQIRMDDGRLGGWAIKLDENGAIMWQETYPRGKMATLRSGAPFKGGGRGNGYVFVGDVEPSGGGRKSGWVMLVDEIGKVLWQRYYTGDYNYIAHDLIAHDDGRIDALLTGSALKGRNDRPFTYLLTISPRGYLMGASAYVDGQGAGAKRLILGPNDNRFFVGSAQTIVPDDVEAGTFTPFAFDAWLVGVPGLDPYNDPCDVNPLDNIRPPENDPF